MSRALTDAITPDIRQALTAARDGTDKLRRQALGYRGMRDVYLRERNAAHEDLIEAERIIELLCNDREAGQAVVKAALTEVLAAWRASLGPCCDMHNTNCEPPSELCCNACTEVNHPHHPPGTVCVLDQPKETTPDA